jgi:hypothetical protein
MYLFCPRKGAEVPGLNALELSKTWGFSGQNKYICGQFGDRIDTINISVESGGLIMRFNVSTRVPTEVTTFFLTVISTFFKV